MSTIKVIKANSIKKTKNKKENKITDKDYESKNYKRKIKSDGL
jgi:hypothetical protein